MPGMIWWGCPTAVPRVSRGVVFECCRGETSSDMSSSRLRFRILGPLAAFADGEPLPIGGPKQRALLALLLLSANRVVPRERLIDELFVDDNVASADHALRNHVSRLRKALAPASGDEPRLVARAPGYLLRVEPGELDLDRCEQLVATAR